jgi:thymidine phosphorylase
LAQKRWKNALIEPFAAVEIISAKRDRNELTDTQIDWVVSA